MSHPRYMGRLLAKSFSKYCQLSSLISCIVTGYWDLLNNVVFKLEWHKMLSGIGD